MDSDTPVLDALDAQLVATLAAGIPADWRLIDAEAKPETYLGPVLYYEQLDIVTTINGGPVPANHIGVEYTLTLTRPETDPIKARPLLNAALMVLLPILDADDHLAWDTAEKIRLTTGETAYRLAIVHLTRYTNPAPATTPEPTPLEA